MKGYDLGLGDYLMEVDIEDENDRVEEAKTKLKKIDATKEKAEIAKEKAEIAKEEAEIAKEEAAEAAKQSKLLLEEIALKKQKLDEIPDTVPDTMLEIYVSDTVESDRDIKALDILERERQMQLDRELEWKKEKRVKKIKRWVKTSLIVFVVGIVGLSLLAGYRIPIPEEVAIHVKGIWESAKDFVVSYFTNN